MRGIVQGVQLPTEPRRNGRIKASTLPLRYQYNVPYVRVSVENGLLGLSDMLDFGRTGTQGNRILNFLVDFSRDFFLILISRMKIFYQTLYSRTKQIHATRCFTPSSHSRLNWWRVIQCNRTRDNTTGPCKLCCGRFIGRAVSIITRQELQTVFNNLFTRCQLVWEFQVVSITYSNVRYGMRYAYYVGKCKALSSVLCSLWTDWLFQKINCILIIRCDSLRAGQSGVRTLVGRDFSDLPNPAPRTTQPPVQWVPAFFPRVKRPGRGADHPPLLSGGVENV